MTAMQAITAKALFNDDRTVTVQLPDDVQIPSDMRAGECEVLLVLGSSEVKVKPTTDLSDEDRQKQLNEVFKAWLKEGEDIPIVPTPITSEYQRDLVEKYRKQGLDL